MKNILTLALMLLLFSCLKEPDHRSFLVDITVDFGEGSSAYDRTGAKVILSNQLKSYSFELNTNSEGKVRFHSIEPGFYSVAVTHSMTVGGIIYYFNGLKNFPVFDSVTEIIQVKESKASAFVIKEFYYSGSLTSSGKSYNSDQYIEIFNNTGEKQFADGMSVIEHESYAIGDNFWKNLHDTIVAKMIWTIPGNGTQVPVEPGKSIVLAKDGINHKDDPNGNPLAPVNLGNADFEFFVRWDTDKDADAPAVPNLIEDLFVFRGSDIAFHVNGGSAVALAKIPGTTPEERKDYINHHLVTKESVSGPNSKFYAKIANKYITDAVEVTWDDAHAIYKRFPIDLDAGYTYVPSGSNSGKCIRRKIKEVVNGRTIYMDTNNSTEDFLKDVTPRPWIYEN